MENKVLIDSLDKEFANYLKAAYDLKKKNNPRLSMRAFSLLIGIDQSLLSKVLSDKRKLSKRSKLQCLAVLQADHETIKKFT